MVIDIRIQNYYSHAVRDRKYDVQRPSQPKGTGCSTVRGLPDRSVMIPACEIDFKCDTRETRAWRGSETMAGSVSDSRARSTVTDALDALTTKFLEA